MKDKITRWLPGTLAAALPLAAYVFTLAPSITFEDSGQLIVAATKLGIPHPSGYPVFCLIGQFFAHIPVSTMAFRANLASACAAACSFMLFLLLSRVLRGTAGAVAPWAAMAGALAFSLSRTFWSQAVITEIYALNALNIVTVLYLAVRWLEDGAARWGYAAAFASGLALATHSSSGLVIFPLAVYAAWRFRRFPRLGSIFFGAACFLLGLSVYLYLPVRAVQSPAINWGDPRTWELFYSHVSRRAYGGPNAERLVFLLEHFKQLGGFLLWELAPTGTALLAVGLVAALRQRLRPFGFFALMLVIYGPFATFSLVLLLQGHQVPEINIWHIPLYIFVAAFVAAGLAALLTLRVRWARYAAVAVLVAAVVLPLGLNYSWADKRGYYFAEDFGSNFERTIGYEGFNVMFERGSLGTFETAYLKKVQWLRPDHLFVDATGCVYSDYELFGYGRAHAPDAMSAKMWEESFERDLLSSAGPRPVYYSSQRDELVTYGLRQEPEGMLFRVYGAPREKTALSPAWGRYRARGAPDVMADPTSRRATVDNWMREAVSRLLIMKGREYLAMGDTARGIEELERAGKVVHGMSEALAEIANIYSTVRRPADSLRYYNLAIDAFPRKGIGDPSFRQHYAGFLANRGIAYMMLGDADNAEKSFKESLEAWPDQPVMIEQSKRENIEAAIKYMQVDTP